MNGNFERRALLGAAATLTLAAPVVAQSGFPSRPIRLIVPWPAGGSTDGQLRALAEAAGKYISQPIIIENRGGASGTLAAAMMAQEQRGDGYVVGQLPIGVFRIPAMTRRPTFDPLRDFTYILNCTGYLFGVVVKADSPWQTWQQFLDHAKANPGRVAYGSPGIGTTLHITMEQIAQLHGIEWLHVPFRGGADNIQAVLSGATQANADSTGWASLVEAGQLRLLCVWSGERARRFPDVPTLKETGTNIESTSPYGIAGPKNMDPGVVRVLHDTFRQALYDPIHTAALERFDMPLIYMNSADYDAFARRQVEEEGAMVRRLGLRID